jgi:hypothetical protein
MFGWPDLQPITTLLDISPYNPITAPLQVLYDPIRDVTIDTFSHEPAAARLRRQGATPPADPAARRASPVRAALSLLHLSESLHHKSPY